MRRPRRQTRGVLRHRKGRTSWRRVSSRRNPGVSALDVALDQFLKLFGDAVALERHRLFAIFVNRGDGVFSRARKADAYVRMLAFAGAVDHASHDGEGHVFHAGSLFAPFRHSMADMALDFLRELLEVSAGGSTAARTGDDHRSERT